jgi:hypothetical protein
VGLERGEANIPDNLRKCYDVLIKLGLVGAQEAELVEAWLEDLGNLSA